MTRLSTILFKVGAFSTGYQNQPSTSFYKSDVYIKTRWQYKCKVIMKYTCPSYVGNGCVYAHVVHSYIMMWKYLALPCITIIFFFNGG